MKAVFLVPVLALILGTCCFAQVVPTTPTGFTTRKTGAISGRSMDTSISVPQASASTTIRHISYVALGEPRQWTSNDGKPLLAKLIAWEQSEQVITQGQPAPEPTLPPMPNGPTVIRDEKVRLLVNGKPFVLPLSRLSEADQELIAQVTTSISQTAQPQPKARTPETSAK